MGYNPIIFAKPQMDRYNAIRGIAGADAAVFVMCAYHNVIYDPSTSSIPWDLYVKAMEKEGAKKFSEGQTRPAGDPDSRAPDRERWVREWGVGNEDKPYTDSDYRHMDRIFETLTARRRASGGFDDQQEDVFRFCARTAHQRDKLMALGDKDSIASAQKLDKMIQDNLAAENLRKRDEAPEQTARVDGIVEAIQKKFGKGITMGFDDAMEIFAAWMAQKGRYNMTQDAAEHALMFIANNMRLNSDLPQLTELPMDAKLDDFADEFNPNAEGREKPIYDALEIGRRKT